MSFDELCSFVHENHVQNFDNSRTVDQYFSSETARSTSTKMRLFDKGTAEETNLLALIRFEPIIVDIFDHL